MILFLFCTQIILLFGFKHLAFCVPDEGYSSNVPDEGYSSNVPDEGYSSNVPNEGYSSNVPDEGYSSNVLDEGYSSNVPDEGYSSNVPNEGYSSNVLDEGYSRNPSCALKLISTFLCLCQCKYHILSDFISSKFHFELISFLHTSGARNVISKFFLLLSLRQYLCWWTLIL